jgi:hypothetical protein
MTVLQLNLSKGPDTAPNNFRESNETKSGRKKAEQAVDPGIRATWPTSRISGKRSVTSGSFSSRRQN